MIKKYQTLRFIIISICLIGTWTSANAMIGDDYDIKDLRSSLNNCVHGVTHVKVTNIMHTGNKLNPSNPSIQAKAQGFRRAQPCPACIDISRKIDNKNKQIAEQKKKDDELADLQKELLRAQIAALKKDK